ncbi:carboxypeptidase regulatory-like domain-containing protein [Variovorax saccharolyticus]|uniref:carboxypeptidase regulatory-like domain-containing protein n=1 Tax=Variovorax saccharolyticus TaxID=3053516 RepID=UPI002575DA6A|nr:carboxypeptidase regulatory-like domain-containing protein [Variovorax sp. J31P216]MDM0026552.1 carboxypeptidase regulatory-like domain-containing protein [Variovorax sp. J31P216]
MSIELAPCPRPQPERSSRVTSRAFGLSLAGAMALALTACGGGGGNGGFFPVGSSPAPSPAAAAAPAPAPAPAQVSISGVAASGSPFNNATLTVVDKTGATVCNTTTDAQGAYTCNLPTTTVFPLVVTAQRGTESLYSVSVNASGGRINVTPITSIVVSRLSPNGDPAALAAAIAAGTAVPDQASVSEQVAQVMAALRPLLDVLGSTVDPITGTFTADGTGHDRVLDSIDVTVRPDGSAANIEVTLQSIPSANEQPISVNFKSSDPTVPALPPVTIDQLAKPGVGDAINALLAKLTQCYALPLSQRVNAPSDTASVTGTATDVISPLCKSAFLGNDPGQYLSSGSRVGRDASGAGSFNSLFRPNATGVIFDQGSLGHYRSNGDVILRYHSLNTAGSESFDTLVARYEGDELKLIGNQYIYSASVRPQMSRREYLNSTGIDWVGVGYNVFANNLIANGQAVFSKVEVTSPTGKVYTLLPVPGNSYLAIAIDGVVTSPTSVVLLNGKFLNGGAGDPRTLEPTQFVDSTVLTDDEIIKIPNQGVWRMEFFHVNQSTANVVQSYRTESRPLTAGEANARSPFVSLTSGMRALLIQRTSANVNGLFVYGAPSASAPNVFDFSNNATDAWTVPATAVGPTLVTVFGRGPLINNVRTNFNDELSIASTVRTATINCTPQSASDPHCDTATGVTQYAQNSFVSTLQLLSRTREQMDAFSLWALYKPAQ